VRTLRRLYPASWRRRYGAEFAALLEDVRITPGVVADIVRGATFAHLDELIARRGGRIWALTQKGDPMLRTFLALLVLGTTALFGFGTVHSIWFDEDVSAFRFMSGVSFAVPVAIGVITLLALVRLTTDRTDLLGRITLAGGLLLVPIGVVGLIAALALGQRSGDYEWGIATGNAALVLQGVLTALYFSGRLRSDGSLIRS
jgi:hypothetical protein